MSQLDNISMVAKYAQMTEGEQFEAVLWGNKPMCVISKEFETSLPYREVPTKIEYTIDSKKRHWFQIDYLYYKRGLEVEAQQVFWLINKDKTKNEHRQLGLLLGYDKEEVESWIAHLETLSNNKGSGNNKATLSTDEGVQVK